LACCAKKNLATLVSISILWRKQWRQQIKIKHIFGIPRHCIILPFYWLFFVISNLSLEYQRAEDWAKFRHLRKLFIPNFFTYICT
jgi:hypothetical protein